MKPGVSFVFEGVCPIFSKNLKVFSYVSSLVCSPDEISTVLFKAAGRQKWVPIVLSGRPECDPRLVIDKVLVFHY